MKLTQQETVEMIQMQSIDEVVEVHEPMEKRSGGALGERKGAADLCEHRDVR